MRRRLVVLVALALVAGSAAAYHGKPGRAGVLAEGPVALAGDLLAAAQPASALYVATGTVRLALLSGEAEAVVTEVRARGGPLAELLPPPDPVVTRHAAGPGGLALAASGSTLNLLVHTHGGLAQFRYAADASAASVLDVGPAGRVAPTDDALAAGLDLARERDAAYEHTAGAAEARLAAPGGTLEALGDFRVFVWDATLQAGGETLRLGAWSDNGDRVARWAVVVLRGAHLRVVDDGALASFRAPVLDLALNGTASFGAARGSAAVDSQDPNLAGDVATMSGVLAITAAPTEKGLRLDASGDFVAATFDGVPRSFAAPAAALGAAALLLAAAVAAWPALKTSGAAALYARFHGPGVLDHDARTRALAHVRARPGASVKDVAEALGVSWSTAAYHLEVLAREGFLARHAKGRHRRYFAAGEVADRDATALLQDPTARRLAELVAQRPGISQKEVAAAAGIAPSTASWQLQRLVRAGVLAEERAWRRVSYRPASTSAGP